MDRGNWRGDILAFFVELLQQLHKKQSKTNYPLSQPVLHRRKPF